MPFDTTAIFQAALIVDCLWLGFCFGISSCAKQLVCNHFASELQSNHFEALQSIVICNQEKNEIRYILPIVLAFAAGLVSPMLQQL